MKSHFNRLDQDNFRVTLLQNAGKKGSQDKFVSVNHAKTKAMNKVEK